MDWHIRTAVDQMRALKVRQATTTFLCFCPTVLLHTATRCTLLGSTSTEHPFSDHTSTFVKPAIDFLSARVVIDLIIPKDTTVVLQPHPLQSWPTQFPIQSDNTGSLPAVNSSKSKPKDPSMAPYQQHCT